MQDLPAALGSLERPRVLVLVTGRTAVAKVGGIKAIRRHVATARYLELEPIVLFPARMMTLGAEISGELDGLTSCVPASEYARAVAEQGGSDDEVLVIAGDWFISPKAIVDFNDATHGPAVARFEDRGRIYAPLARIRIGDLERIIPELDTQPVSELIHRTVDPNARIVTLPVTERHRLSDNVAISRCEAKLFGLRSEKRPPIHVEWMEKLAAIPLATRLAATPITPLQVSGLRIIVACVAAWILARGGHWTGILGAAVYGLSRIFDATAGHLARAAVRPHSQGERTDVIGEFLTSVIIVWALAIRPEAGDYATIAASIATAGLVISALLAVVKVFGPAWRAADRKGLTHVNPDNFASRFARSQGTAIALLIAALAGRLDLFLWASAAASHVFYLVWLYMREEPGS